MSATALEAFTVAFPNPEWQPASASNNIYNRIPANISFFYINPPLTLRTLSTNAASPGSDVTGLLYVPDLPPHDPCVEASEAWVPQNVTRQKNIPVQDAENGLVAMAPWLSKGCTLKYLESARGDPIRGFLFFLPNNKAMEPHLATSDTWNLGDNDAWKRDYHFPVYAMPGQTGNLLMRASTQYSGNMTDVPHGHLLTESFDARGYVRLFVDIHTSGGTTLPSLWVFLLVVLGILLSVIAFTSLMMHLLQRRRRQALRQRVADGEVDLEALGIKRLTVPRAILERMPLYAYGSGAPVQPSSLARETEKPEETAEGISSTPSQPPQPATQPPLTRSSSYRPTPLQQPTCAICLDDFIPAPSPSTTSSPSEQAGTIVRELPCHHIFHPECVDTFLRDNSSLCPMCKKSVLPRGYCPRVVTNAMVRRERMVRRIRPTATETEDAGGDEWIGSIGRAWSTTRLGLGMGGGGRRVSSLPVPLPASRSGREMQEMRTNGATSTVASPAAVLPRSNTTVSAAPRRQRSLAASRPSSNPGRREWARQRAVAMLGRSRAPLDPDAEEQQQTPRWRKAVRGIFPASGGVGRRL